MTDIGGGGPAARPNDEGEPAASQSSSGASKAGKALDAAGRVVDATGTAITKLYGLVLLVVGIVGIFVLPSAWWAGILLALYGLYLVWPGGAKWVIY